MRRTTYSATSTEHDVPRDAASVTTAPERRSWMSASPVTSVRRQPPRTVRERPRPSARMVTGLSSATPQSSDSPTHMIQSVDASDPLDVNPVADFPGRNSLEPNFGWSGSGEGGGALDDVLLSDSRCQGDHRGDV